jgi:hypothetical protein
MCFQPGNKGRSTVSKNIVGMLRLLEKTWDAQIPIYKMSLRVTRLSSVIHSNQIHCLFFAQAGQPLEVLYSIPCIGQDNHVTPFPLLS